MSSTRSLVWLWLPLAACAWITPAEQEAFLDRDGDGTPWSDDCDDADAARHPGVAETCNGVDDDCDGDTDEQATDLLTWLVDADGDGFGVDGSETSGCARPSAAADVGGDCDDGLAAVHPGAAEVCNDLDDDCDDDVDDADAGITGQTTWYIDGDGDTFGAATVVACDAPTDGILTGGDCDDTDGGVHPGATERCDGVDNDCDTGTAEPKSKVGFLATSGAWTDLTSTFQAGTSTSPAVYAAGTDGRLQVCGGSWFARIEVETGALDIAGATAALNAGGKGPVVDVQMPGAIVSVSSMSLTNGYVASANVFAPEGGAGIGNQGGGIGASVTLSDVTISGNAGAGIWFEDGDVTATDVLVASNSFGVWVTRGDVTFTDVDLTSNLVWGLLHYGPGTLTWEGGKLHGNGDHAISAGDLGAGNVVSNVEVTGHNNFDNNGIWGASTEITFDGVSIHDNNAQALWVHSGASVTFVDSEISGGNRTTGGGVRVEGNAELTLIDTVIDDNSAEQGGGLWVLDGTVTCKSDTGRSAFTNNSASSTGGAVYLSTSAKMTIDDCDFSGNTPNDIAVSNGSTYTAGMGAKLICASGSGAFCK